MTDAGRRWHQGALTLEAHTAPGELRVVWSGRSDEREPARFLAPLLAELVETCRSAQARLRLDFTALEFMNSSTFTPIVKAIADSRSAGVAIALEYAQAKRWQALSFSALRTFETRDGSVAVLGR
ncbi:MAG TPA: hypothetical protein VEB43_05675 [Anaeromyxobacter sp.]|nr:hypothetical protein [Anaeromyxobacter sp.]